MEYLFRGRRKDNGEWVYGGYFTIKHNDDDSHLHHVIVPMPTLEYPTTDVFAEVDLATVGMFVWLWDDTGKQIFCDDIVKIQNKDETKTSYMSQVYFGCNGARVYGHPAHLNNGMGQRYRDLLGYCNYGDGEKFEVSCEIVGNIHDGVTP